MRKILKFNILFIIIMFTILFFTGSKVETMQYAYSIGSKYGTGLDHAGDDFTQNVLTAANAYGRLSNVTSYYRTEPTYSYLTGNNALGQRRIASHIVFVNGHANATLIMTPAKNEADYRVGICTGYDGARTTDGLYTFAGLNSVNMSSCSLITFAGCSTGQGIDSLTGLAYTRGAKIAVGFNGEISSRSTQGRSWLQTYNNSLGNGNSVYTSIINACNAYPNSDLSVEVIVAGDTGTTLGVGNLSTMNLNSNFLQKVDPISNTYEVIANTSLNIEEKQMNHKNDKLDSCEDEFKDIISIIKNSDADFEVSDYTVTSNLFDKEKGDGLIFFKYFINDKIETNKVYMGIIKNNKLQNIILSGVKKENISNLSSDLDKEIDKTIDFENKKIENILKNQGKTKTIKTDNIQLNSEGKIEKNSLDNAKDVKEKYYFDYNTQELKYILSVTQEKEYETQDVEVIEIVL